MITDYPKIEAPVDILRDARKKFDSCKFKSEFSGQAACALRKYFFDTAFDMLHHCSSCIYNTKKPTTHSFEARGL